MSRHTSTFAANPLASAVGIAAVDVVISEGLAERSRRLGAELKDRLNSISSPYTTVKATGRGLFCALHIDESHPSGRVTAERLSRLMRKLGVVIIAVGNRLRIAPPLVIKEEDLWKGVDILEEALSKLIYVDDI